MPIVFRRMKRRNKRSFEDKDNGEITNAAEDCPNGSAYESEAQGSKCAVEW